MKYSIAVALSLALGMAAAFAQTPPPAPAPAAPSVQSAAPPAAAGRTDKKALSKSCTDQANAKALHGKARKKFRSECKKNGGKAS